MQATGGTLPRLLNMGADTRARPASPRGAQAAAQVVATIQAGRPACCLAFGANAVWAASFATDAVVRIGPAANAVVDAFPSGGLGPEGIAFGDGYVWVANHHGDPTRSVAKIDPATDTVIDVIAVGAVSPAGGPSFLAAVPGSVWAGVPMPSPRSPWVRGEHRVMIPRLWAESAGVAQSLRDPADGQDVVFGHRHPPGVIVRRRI